MDCSLKPSFRDRILCDGRRGDVMHLDLTEKEAAALVTVLEHYISELRGEVGHTDLKSIRDALKGEEDVLKNVLGVLKAGSGRN
jgi:hypothetical protein